MKTCRTCNKRETCARLCPLIEGQLPKDNTGKNTHLEVSMGTDDFERAIEKGAYKEWYFSEASIRRLDLNISMLTKSERRAVLLLASGLSQREVAARMKISRASLRTHMDRAKDKLHVAHFAHIIEGQNKPGTTEREGGGRWMTCNADAAATRRS
jgi:DNA-binding CsgD family transcriptional regulator